MKELVRITDMLCKTFARIAERHRKKMTKAMLRKESIQIDGGEKIRLPLNYGEE